MNTTNAPANSAMTIELIFAWVWVGIPLVWGVYVTAVNAAKLFQ